MPENEALAQICQTKGFKPEQLKPVHTDKSWAWELIEAGEDIKKTYRIGKDKMTQKEATEAAMMHFDTFEGNLHDESTDEDYVFSKVRE